MELQAIVPFGRSYEEYTRMFGLTASDLSGRILGAGDGPAGFNAEATRQGAQVLSIDPLYAYSRQEIAGRIDEVVPELRRQVELNRAQFQWDRYRTIDELMTARQVAMQTFLADYDEGRAAGRYREAALPTLPFADRSFDLALVSHLLFLYSAHLDAEFHRRALQELLRVADEVRVFPLLTLKGEPSPHLAPLRRALGFAGIPSAVKTVNYEMQKGANQMLILRRPARPRWPGYTLREFGVPGAVGDAGGSGPAQPRWGAAPLLPSASPLQHKPPLTGQAG